MILQHPTPALSPPTAAKKPRKIATKPAAPPPTAPKTPQNKLNRTQPKPRSKGAAKLHPTHHSAAPTTPPINDLYKPCIFYPFSLKTSFFCSFLCSVIFWLYSRTLGIRKNVGLIWHESWTALSFSQQLLTECQS